MVSEISHPLQGRKTSMVSVTRHASEAAAAGPSGGEFQGPLSLETPGGIFSKYQLSRHSTEFKKQTSIGPVIIDSSKVPLLDHQKSNPLFIEKAIVHKPAPEVMIKTAYVLQQNEQQETQDPLNGDDEEFFYEPPSANNGLNSNNQMDSNTTSDN